MKVTTEGRRNRKEGRCFVPCLGSVRVLKGERWRRRELEDWRKQPADLQTYRQTERQTDEQSHDSGMV